MPIVRFAVYFVLIAITTLAARPAAAADWYVAAGGAGNGTAAAPFGTIQQALNAAQPGDTVNIGPGTFRERLATVRPGSSGLPVRLRASNGRGTTIVTAPGRVLSVGHAYHTFEGLILDGQYGADDLIRVASGATRFILRNSEVRYSSRDAIDMGSVTDVLIEGSLIHHALNATGGRTDAHGIVAASVRRLTIRNTEIHTFSGDAIQIDPARSSPGWSDVLIEGCKLWLAPLPAAVNGFAAGTVPGENAVDTKVSTLVPRAKLTIRNTEARGFRAGLISNMAAFNLKENIDATVDRVTVFNSEIAFRLRAPALVRVQNAVVHTVATGVRYEDGIQNVRLWNSTFGGGVTRPFYAASSSGSILDVRNVLVLGTTLPAQAPASASNLAVPASAFVNAAAHNYQLSPSSPAADAGAAISAVTTDRQGTKRPQGTRYDIGAFERVVAAATIASAQDPDVVLHAWKASVVRGNWHVMADVSAAGGSRLASENDGRPKLNEPLAQPADYFELTFTAEAGRPYRLWIRGNAELNHWANDSVFAQFNRAVDAGGSAIYRIGSGSAAAINLEDCSGCGLSGWGWQDTGWGTDVLGPVVYFETTGPQTLRIQTREDGLSIDQIVISPSAYLTSRPGGARNDATILPESW